MSRLLPVSGLSLTLHDMQADDLDAVLAIEVAGQDFPWTPGNFRDSLEHAATTGSHHAEVVRDATGKMLAFIVLSFVLDEAHLLNISVHPAFRGRGIARALLHHAQELASARHSDTLFLEVRPSNTVALALYHSMGFNEIGLRRNYYPLRAGGHEDGLMMALVL